MKKEKSTKTYANTEKSLYKQIKDNISDPYFLDVLYYHVRLALINKDFNLSDIDVIAISGKYLGYDIEVWLNGKYNNVLMSLNLALSLRSIIINSDYFKLAYNDYLIFNLLNKDYLSWDIHRVIMENLVDEDFATIYKMIVSYKSDRVIPEELRKQFKKQTVKPERRHLEEFCKILAARDDYHGRTVIKNNAYLYSDIEEFVVNKKVDYVGNTAFAYCENLKKIVFEGKVLFGYFPIIECKNLEQIIVPTDLLEYYKEVLPYYKDIVTDVESVLEEPVKKEEKQELEIEHVYVGTPSADSYIETEVEVDEPEETMDFSVIEKVFEKKATTYKFFWFLAILKVYKVKGENKILFKDILIKMVSIAWRYVFFEKSEFPKIDQLPGYLVTIDEMIELNKSTKGVIIDSILLDYYVEWDLDSLLSPLLKNVPYRFLSPWIPFTSNDDVVAKSNNPDTRCPYSLHEDHIVINPKWGKYFLDNYNKLTQFVEKELRSYMKIK